MRKFAFVAFCMLVSGSAAMAQSKINTVWHCAADASKQASFDVGDVAGHSYAIVQGTCTATKTATGDKTGAFTEFDENWTASYTNRGRFNVTKDSGDMVYYSYSGSGPADIKKPAKNTWKILSGTGKQKGITGSGGCTGVRNADGSSDWTCTGTSMMPAAAAPAK
jgi:hypothetical protein